MMPDEHTLQLAVKYAARLTRMQLAGRINEMAHRRRMAEEMRLMKRKSRALNGYGDSSCSSAEEEEESGGHHGGDNDDDGETSDDDDDDDGVAAVRDRKKMLAKQR